MRPSLTIACALLLMSLAAHAAPVGFMSVTGAKQGAFKGESAGRRDSIEILAYASEIDSPRDTQSGQPTGRRQHKPIVITKEIDAASPQFFESVVTNEVLKTVTITLVKPAAGPRAGAAESYYTIKLTNATITSLKHSAEQVNGRPTGNELEEIALTFEKIEVESPNGKTSASDSWLAR